VWNSFGPKEQRRIQADTGAVMVPLVHAFGLWLDRSGLSRRTIERHTGNALHFISWLYISRRNEIEAVTEVDLRLFLFSACAPKAERIGGSDPDAVPVSLKRLFRFLAEERGLSCPWAESVLAERDAYAARRRTYPARPRRPGALDDWERVLGADLDSRVLLADERMGWDDEWEPDKGPEAGPLARKLHWELGRLWLLWREGVIRRGQTDPELVRAAVLPRQRAWERAPHPELGGRCPIDAVRAERGSR
jgi:hypothetical protein